MFFDPKIETMSRERLEETQLARLQEVVRRVYTNVEFYRKSFNERGIHPEDIKTLEDIKKLPFTKKQDLRDHSPFGLFAVSMDKVVRIHSSSGSKGTPTVVGYTQNDLNHWSDIAARAVSAAGGKPGDIVQNSFGYGLFTGGLGMHYGIERLGAAVMPVSVGNTPRQINLIQELKPRGILSTPSYILKIIEEMEKLGINTRATSLKYGIFGAESWTEEMRKKIEEKLDIKAVDLYGLSEVMGPAVAIECHDAQDGLHVAEDHFLVEVIDPNGEVLPYGQEGEVVFTTLTKEAFPVIRYRTGDIGSLNPTKCKCGRTFVRMSRLKGRVDDMLIIRGVNVFPTDVESVLLGFEQLAPHYQIVIGKDGPLDRFEVHCEAAHNRVLDHGETTEHLIKNIQNSLKDALGVSAIIEFHLPGTLPRSEGKAVRIIDNREKIYQKP